VGTYRITAIKNEFEIQSKTVVVKENEKITETFYLERPDATVYGKVLDEAGKGINLATVYGISDRGDTVKASTDALGSFILNCYSADWRIGVSMAGYKTTIVKKITVASAQNYSYGTVVLEKNPFTLSGVVKNTSGAALLGVRIRLYKDGVLLSEIPSTPQNGSFSFSVPAGTYALVAEKTGFTSYNKNVDVMSSKSISVAMEPGAALISGYIYGKTWVGEREVIAPLTSASVQFIQDDTGDTTSIKSGSTYGDFKASLTGEKKFVMSSSADGFVPIHGPVTFTTVPKTTVVMYDTLLGLGMVAGTVTLSSTGVAVSGVTVNLTGAADGKVAASAKTTANGTFEIRKIPDGMYVFRAAKDGLVLDSIGGPDSITLSQGKPSASSVRIYLKPGNKTIKFVAENIDSRDVTVKIQSPLVKSISLNDSLTKAGPGKYIVSIDVKNDSVVDLATHQFTVYDTESVHIDTVLLNVIHSSPDTVLPENGEVSISLRATTDLDSATIYYKDAVATKFSTKSINDKNTTFTFEFIPPRDGSTMLYYFKAYRGSDVFGYDKEVHSVYVSPDMSMLTRFEIVPTTDKAYAFPAKYETTFELKGYVSSSFMLAPAIDASAVTWALVGAQGSSLKNSTGLKTVLSTGSAKSSVPAYVRVTIDKNKVALAPDLSAHDSVGFTVTGADVKEILVDRTDGANPNPITTSSTDKAEFSARGIDADGNTIDLYPAWSISPSSAGSISSSGLFKPARNFAGIVRILASVGSVSGEYRVTDKGEPGLNVRYMIVRKSSPDTVVSKNGCSVIFPPNVVDNNDRGLLEITTSSLKNQFKRTSGILRTIDTSAFEIQQLENITLTTGSDSIRLNLAIPESMQEGARTGKQKLSIAQWVDDSLLWKKLSNTTISKDGKTARVALTHFSRYSIVYEPADNLLLDIAPNPFSPFIVPHYNPFNTDDKVTQHPGTCIRVQADVQEARTEIKIKIYTLVGDQVWSMLLQNADNLPYYIWWDGRTSVREQQPAGTNHVITPKGDTMCRNGRYFLVLTAKVNGKEQKIMKQIILMK